MKPIVIAAGLLALLSTPVRAAGVYSVKPLDGYGCAWLNATEAQMRNPKGTGIVIREAPDPAAPVGTTAPGLVFVRTPAHVVGGFAEVLQLNGKPGWIETRNLKPYDPNARCVPSMMSNGRIGNG
jgi:hypothetical protein